MAVAVAALEAMLRDAQYRALHLETRDAYSGSAAFAAWQEGREYDRSTGDMQWRAMLGPLLSRGGDIRRARIVSEPISAYVRHHKIARPVPS